MHSVEQIPYLRVLAGIHFLDFGVDLYRYLICVSVRLPIDMYVHGSCNTCMKTINDKQKKLRDIVLREPSKEFNPFDFGDLLYGVNELSWFDDAVLFPHDFAQGVPFVHENGVGFASVELGTESVFVHDIIQFVGM